MNSQENEYAVLSAIKIDNKVYDDLGLRPSDFYIPEYAEIYLVMGLIIESGREANDMTIIAELQERKSRIKPSAVACLDYPTTANIKHHVNEIREYSKHRQIEKMIPMIKDGLETKKSADILEDIEQAITAISESAVHDIQWLKDLLYPTICEIEKLYNLKGGFTGIRSGFSKLDTLTNGFQRGDLIVIGARPSVGKTAFAMTMAINMCSKYNAVVGFFSCEMSVTQLGLRIISGQAKINLSLVKNGMMNPRDFDRINTAGEQLNKSIMAIDDTPNIRLVDLKSRARKMKRLGVQIIFVDYLTLIKHGSSNIPRHEQVGDISKNLKQLARELDIPVIALSQVTRGAEGKMPNLADLRQSGEIEEDADVIMFLHRGDGEEQTKLRVAKHRNGATDTVELYFIPQYVRFEDVSYEDRG
jgi:replicative DNA helicase